MQETHEMQVQSLAREDPLQEDMPTHSSILTGPVRHSYGQRSLEAYIPQGCKELDTIELHYINYINTEIHTHTHTLLAWHEPNNQFEAFKWHYMDKFYLDSSFIKQWWQKALCLFFFVLAIKNTLSVRENTFLNVKTSDREKGCEYLVTTSLNRPSSNPYEENTGL